MDSSYSMGGRPGFEDDHDSDSDDDDEKSSNAVRNGVINAALTKVDPLPSVAMQCSGSRPTFVSSLRTAARAGITPGKCGSVAALSVRARVQWLMMLYTYIMGYQVCAFVFVVHSSSPNPVARGSIFLLGSPEAY